jgi:phage gp36-like protein
MRKHPSEVVDVPIDFTARMGVGESMVSATASVAGTGTITVGSTPVVTSVIVTVRVSGGTEGATDHFLVLATTDAGQVLPVLVEVFVTAAPFLAASYSTPERLAARIGPLLYAQLTAEQGNVDENIGNDTVAQNQLNTAQQFIHRYIGNVYATPVTSPASQVSVLAGVEEDVAYWYLWSDYRGISDSDNAAAGAFKNYEAAKEWLISIRDGDAVLPGVTPRPADATANAGGWTSNRVVYRGDRG